MKTVAIIQARMESTRLPGKSLAILGTKPLIDHVVERAMASEDVDELYLATTTSPADDDLASHVDSSFGISIYRGSKLDVRSRFVDIAQKTHADLIVRITADDPFKDPAQIGKAIKLILDKELEYACNFEPRMLPIGMDIEVFTANALLRSDKDFDNALDREHVTWSMRTEDFSWASFGHDIFEPNLRLTVDLPEDFEYCSRIARILHREEGNFSWEATRRAIEEERRGDSIDI